MCISETFILLNCSCVLVWDTRPPKGPSQLLTKKEDDKGTKNPMGVPDTFKHLDLSWKPFLRVRCFIYTLFKLLFKLLLEIQHVSISCGTLDLYSLFYWSVCKIVEF